MAYTSAQLQSKAQRDKINESMRASPQWRSAIKGLGLNPDGPLKLDKKQQQSLAATLGLPTSDFHIDGAGNINDYHGWKGLPVAAKVAIIAGATVATAGAAGAFSGGGAAAASGAGGGTLASSSIPTAALMGGPAAITSAGVSAAAGTGLGTAATVAGGAAAAKTGFGALVKKYGKDILGMGANVAHGAAEDMAAGRSNQIEAAVLQEKMRQDQRKIWEDQLLNRQKEKRANSNDAWNKLMTGSYTAGYKGAGPDANNPYVLPMAGATDSQVEAGNALVTASRPTVTDGNIGLPPLQEPTDFQIDPNLLNSGGWEKLLGYGSVGLGSIDAWRKLNAQKGTA